MKSSKNSDWKNLTIKMVTVGTVATNGASALFLVNRRRPRGTVKANEEEKKKESQQQTIRLFVPLFV